MLGYEFQIEIAIVVKYHGTWTWKIGRIPDLGNVGRLGGKSDSVPESSATYQTEPVAVDTDSDFDPEDEKL